MEEYGPFVNLVGIALALVVVFSTMVVKMLGNLNKWTWLTSNMPGFMITAGGRMVAVVLMAIAYLSISESNYLWFAFGALISGVFGFWCIYQFNYLRNVFVHRIPLVGEDGSQMTDDDGKLVFENVIIGTESQMMPHAKDAFDEARKSGGLSIGDFMSGYGKTKLNDPLTIWTTETIASNNNRLFLTLMYIVLCAVMALFIAALIIEVIG